MVGWFWIQGLWSAQRLCPCADPRAILCGTVLWTARAHYPRGTSRVRMNSFRRPVLSSAISYHCVSTALLACRRSAHSSTTLRAEKKRRVESARMLGSTRRYGYPSDSSRRRRSQPVDGLTATTTPATRRPHRPGPGSGDALPPGRCKPKATRTGPPLATDGNPPPSPARAWEWRCSPARTVQAAGDSDGGPRSATDGDPPPPPARAGEWRCPPARTVQAAGDSDRTRRRRFRRPHQSGPGIGKATPPGRCSAPRTARLRPTRIGRVVRAHGRRLAPGANGHGLR